MNVKNLIIILVCYMLFFTANCNIFVWTIDGEEELFYEGLELFNQKKFKQAEEKFARAMELDSLRSDYRYYHAKSVVFSFDLNFFKIARKILEEIDTTSIENLKLPLYTREENMTVQEDCEYKNSIYQPTWICHEDITPIYIKKTHGDIQADDVYFEYSILSLARAILQLRDTNNDKLIDENDFYFTITKIHNPINNKYYFLPNFIDLKNYLTESEKNRKGFNEMLVNSAIYSAEGIISLEHTFADTILFDNEDLENIIADVDTMSTFYQIADGIDNDGDGEDNDGNPLTPAVADGIDNDGDGDIDEGIDEENLDGNDDDDDGYVDEDPHL